MEGVLKVAADTPVLVLQDTNSTGNSYVSMIRWYDSLDQQRAWIGFGSTSNSTSTFDAGVFRWFDGAGARDPTPVS